MKMCHTLSNTKGLREQTLVVEEALGSPGTPPGLISLVAHNGLGVRRVRSGVELAPFSSY